MIENALYAVGAFVMIYIVVKAVEGARLRDEMLEKYNMKDRIDE